MTAEFASPGAPEGAGGPSQGRRHLLAQAYFALKLATVTFLGDDPAAAGAVLDAFFGSPHPPEPRPAPGEGILERVIEGMPREGSAAANFGGNSHRRGEASGEH